MYKILRPLNFQYKLKKTSLLQYNKTQIKNKFRKFRKVPIALDFD